ncbi:DUF1831 domain-containing protein [Alkalibacterium iburiense]|uniref:DUF1831 domain-containing protein n=1 Tax=Alkalibacterium iburiense TaxID=290589 RepID=A0ABP3H7N9_9LACT
MSNKNNASLPGSSDLYVINEQAKRYTLRDNGFTETKNGTFIYERSLGTTVMDKKAPKLKVTVSKDFSELKLSSVSANGLKKIDLYKGSQFEKERELAEHILKTFVEENVLDKA